MNNIRRVSASTKALILGNGGSYVQHLKAQIDAFLKDAQRLNEAGWRTVLEAKDKVYKLLDTVLQPEKGAGSKNKNVSELKRAWRRTSNSGRSLYRDLQRGAKQVQTKRT